MLILRIFRIKKERRDYDSFPVKIEEIKKLQEQILNIKEHEKL